MTITKSEFDYIRGLLRDRSALVLEPGKEYLVESRLIPLARQEGFPTLRKLVENLRLHPSRDLHRKVVEAMMINETSFFREIRVFEMFKKTILPELLIRRASSRSCNFWCAACCTGQVPDSLGMLLHEHAPSLDSWKIKFVASDISMTMLGRAREGRYSQGEVNRGLPASLLVKYFKQHGTSWQIHPAIRKMVEFLEINLIHPWPSLPRMDAIFFCVIF